MPDLEKLVDLCRSLDSWLRADKQNIIVLHCHVSVDTVSVLSRCTHGEGCFQIACNHSTGETKVSSWATKKVYIELKYVGTHSSKRD